MASCTGFEGRLRIVERVSVRIDPNASPRIDSKLTYHVGFEDSMGRGGLDGFGVRLSSWVRSQVVDGFGVESRPMESKDDVG